MQDYYQKIYENLILLKKEKPLMALLKLEEELTAPYIPKEWEQKFINLRIELKALIQSKPPNINLSKDEIFSIIQNPKHPLIALALMQLKDINLSGSIEVIQKLFDNPKMERVMCSIIYEFLVMQKVNHNFNMRQRVVNPIIEGSISTNKNYLRIVHEINSLTFKNPTLNKVAIQNFENVALKLFPPHAEYNESFARVFTAIASEMLATTPEIFLTENELKQKNFFIMVIREVR